MLDLPPPAPAGSLTPRERFVRQLRRQPVDRSFDMEFGYWQENFQQWRIFRDHGIADNEAADRFFGFDRIASIGARLWLDPPFPEEEIRRDAATRTIRNADGLLAEVPLEGGGSSIPHYMASSVTTPEEWARCKEQRLRRGGSGRTLDLAAIRAAHPPDRTWPLGINCGSLIGKIRDLLTFEGLAYACHDHPEMVEDMVETCCLIIEDQLDQVLGVIDVDFASGWEDICYNAGPIVSLPFFNEVLLPRYRRIGAKLRRHGVDIWYTDCDGDVRRLLPGWIEAGLDTLFPWEVKGSGEPDEALRRWPRLRIMGGIDKLVLKQGRGAIRALLERLAPAVRAGGFIPFCDHRCPPDVPEEDYVYYLATKRELFCAPHG